MNSEESGLVNVIGIINGCPLVFIVSSKIFELMFIDLVYMDKRLKELSSRSPSEFKSPCGEVT